MIFFNSYVSIFPAVWCSFTKSCTYRNFHALYDQTACRAHKGEKGTDDRDCMGCDSEVLKKVISVFNGVRSNATLITGSDSTKSGKGRTSSARA